MPSSFLSVFFFCARSHSQLAQCSVLLSCFHSFFCNIILTLCSIHNYQHKWEWQNGFSRYECCTKRFAFGHTARRLCMNSTDISSLIMFNVPPAWRIWNVGTHSLQHFWNISTRPYGNSNLSSLFPSCYCTFHPLFFYSRSVLGWLGGSTRSRALWRHNSLHFLRNRTCPVKVDMFTESTPRGSF